jgi:hypothetical protein
MTTLKELRGDLVFTLPVAAIAGGSVGETPGLVLPFNATVTGVKWVPAANITANGTNFFTLILRNRGAAGSGTAQAATRAYSATNGVAHTAENMTLSGTAADLQLAAGDVLTVQKTEGGTGLAMPAGVVQVSVRVR